MSSAICPVINQQEKEMNLKRENYKIEKQIFENLSFVLVQPEDYIYKRKMRIILALVSIFM